MRYQMEIHDGDCRGGIYQVNDSVELRDPYNHVGDLMYKRFGFDSVIEAKIFGALIRQKWIEKELWKSPVFYKEDSPYIKTIKGEHLKTDKWLLEKSKHHPELII